MEKETETYIEWFRQSTPYIKSHRNKTFVLWLSGETVANEQFDSLVHDINLLHSLGIKLVLVHGARPQIDEALAAHGKQSPFSDGTRVSSLENLETICQSSALVRMKIEALFTLGITNSPMQDSGVKISSGNYINAKPKGVIEGIDYQHTGEVRSVNTEAISELLESDHIVLLSNIAYSPTGEMFNLGSEEVACACAVALEADKLILFSGEEGIFNKHGALLRELTPQASEEEIKPDQQGLFRHCINAVEAGVKRAHVVSYQKNGALIKELFSRDGSGTLISQNPYEILRQASIEDVSGILDLISPLEEKGVLVKRSREVLENEIDKFTVLERDGHIIACAALYLYDESPIAELACICVEDFYKGADRGEKLLSFIESQAKFLGLEKLFVLTTQTAHWFLERGFEKTSIDTLPVSKQNLYNFQRNSLIFIKDLN